jgi:hypothetical protein
MKLALEMLGFGPCHHMKEVIGDPEQKRIWRSIACGDEANWGEVFAGYHSAVDWPSAYFWRELSAYYPNAKVLLTQRSSESWYASMEKTIFKSLGEASDRDSVGVKLIAERVFGGRLDDREHATAIYEKNIAEVQATFGEDRLLTYNIGDGWEPLCRFLDTPIPDIPYPRTNPAEDFHAMIADLNKEGRR